MIKYFLIILILIASVISDVRTSKIRNSYVVTAILSGLLINLSFYGFKGLTLSIMGIFTPILLLGIFFAAGQLGAGDIKLLSGIGAYFGWKFVIITVAYSFLLAGIIALSGLLARSDAKSTFKDFFMDIKLCLLTKKLCYMKSLYSRKTLKLSPSIAVAVILQTFLILA